MAGKECVLFAETEKTLVKENCLDVEGFSCCPSEDGVPGMRNIVLSPSGIVDVLVFILRCGSRFLTDDFVLVELGLGGNPADAAFVEVGLDKEGIFVLVEPGNALSNDLAGICKEERFGLLD